MRKLKSTKALATALFASGLFDVGGALYFVFLVGVGRSIESPPTHPFYAILIGVFLLSLAYLQLLSSRNVKRYLLVVGGVIISRICYAVLLFAYLVAIPDFPMSFLPTAILDLVWTGLYIVLVLASEEIRVRDLFLPNRASQP